MLVVLGLLLLPIVEIALFIVVGGAIGLWPTLLLVVASALAGMAILRNRGIGALARLQGTLAEGGDPLGPMAHGALVILAGVLLLIPGFLTDAIGLILLIPGARRRLLRWLAARVQVVTVRSGPAPRQHPSPAPGGVIDVDYEVVDDVPPGPRRGGSGWTRPED